MTWFALLVVLWATWLHVDDNLVGKHKVTYLLRGLTTYDSQL